MAVKNLNSGNFQEIVNQKPTVIDFWAEWCMPCRMMGPVFEELSEEHKDINFAKLNTDDEPMLASKFNIEGIPCLVVMKDGKEVDRIVGLAPKNIIKKKLEGI